VPGIPIAVFIRVCADVLTLAVCCINVAVTVIVYPVTALGIPIGAFQDLVRPVRVVVITVSRTPGLSISVLVLIRHVVLVPVTVVIQSVTEKRCSGIDRVVCIITVALVLRKSVSVIIRIQ
jgi:hypothetical protein